MEVTIIEMFSHKLDNTSEFVIVTVTIYTNTSCKNGSFLGAKCSFSIQTRIHYSYNVVCVTKGNAI